MSSHSPALSPFTVCLYHVFSYLFQRVTPRGVFRRTLALSHCYQDRGGGGTRGRGCLGEATWSWTKVDLLLGNYDTVLAESASST